MITIGNPNRKEIRASRRREGMGMMGAAAEGIGHATNAAIWQPIKDNAAMDMWQQQTQTNFENQKAMTDYNYQKAYDMWNKTDSNYKRLVEKYEDAGLNVGLMAKGTGAGGVTAQPAGTTGGTSVRMEGGNGGSGMGMIAIAGAQAEANIELAKANARKADAEAAAIGGYQKDKAVAETGLVGVTTAIKEIEKRVSENTEVDQTVAIQAAAGKLQGEMNTAIANGTIKQQTVITEIAQAKADLVGTYIENKLKNANIAYTQEQTAAIKDYIEVAYMNAYSQRRNSLASEKDADTRLHQQIQENLYKDDLIKLGERKLDQDLVMGAMGLITGQGAQSGSTSTTTNYDADGNYKGESTTTRKNHK